MDGSKQRPRMTAGLDLGDRYSYLCLIDQQNGEVMEEGRLRTTPKHSGDASRGAQRPLRAAICSAFGSKRRISSCEPSH